MSGAKAEAGGLSSGMLSARAFTVLDLLIVLAIVTIMLAIGAPALGTLLLEGRMTREVNGLVHGIHRARQEAHVRGRQTVLCPRSRHGGCAASGDWSLGWLLVGHDPMHPTAGQVLLASRTASGIRLRANRQRFVFRPFQIRSTNGRFWLCDRRGPPASRAVVLSPAGRPRTEAPGPASPGEPACES